MHAFKVTNKKVENIVKNMKPFQGLQDLPEAYEEVKKMSRRAKRK